MSDPLRPGIQVIEPSPDSLIWDFRSEKPRYRIEFGCEESCAHWETVDPMPCYRHDRGVLEHELEMIRAVAPPKSEVTFALMAHEDTARVNAWASEIAEWAHRKGTEKEDRDTGYGHALVWMNGKRTPPHPAMTRYLAWHEYGHHVEDWIRRARKLSEGEMRRQYVELRGLNPEDQGYAAQTWHRSPGEIIACDFRVIIGSAELEFWPHPGIPRPNGPDLLRWWRESMEMLYG